MPGTLATDRVSKKWPVPLKLYLENVVIKDMESNGSYRLFSHKNQPMRKRGWKLQKLSVYQA